MPGNLGDPIRWNRGMTGPNDETEYKPKYEKTEFRKNERKIKAERNMTKTEN